MGDTRRPRLRFPRGLLWVLVLAAILALLGTGIYERGPFRASRGVLVARQSLAVWEAPENAPRGASMIATGQFEVANLGADPVRILDVKSDCGCATPEVTPRIIEPGRNAIVSVSATVVPYLSRDLGINIQTDSPTTPDVFLRFRVTGNQRPPLLIDVSGDLSFVGVYSKGEQRELTVVTSEREGESRSPAVSSNLRFLEFEERGSEEASQGGGLTLRKRRFSATLSDMPPAGTSVGRVTVTDPWDPRNTRDLNVLVRRSAAMSCSPTFVEVGPTQRDASVLITTDRPVGRLKVTTELPAGLSVDLVQEPVGPTGTVYRVRAAVREPYPTSRTEGKLRVVAEGLNETLIVPVVFASGEKVGAVIPTP
jgi:hypothetical protein